MREQPVGDDLLFCARDFLKTNILPELDGEKKHGVLMIMNAMAIAARQLQNGERCEQEELRELRALLSDRQCDPLEGYRLLAELLREGAGDPGRPEREALLKHLWKMTGQRVLESNPKTRNE